MRLCLFLTALIAGTAHAELYRWIDPDTGTVKFSTLTPSDPRAIAERVPYKEPRAPGAPSAKPAAAAAPAAGSLEGRWSDLLSKMTGLTPAEVTRGGDGLKQHLEAYDAVSRELDRLDPAGAARRRAQAETMLEKLKKGLAAQFSPTPAIPGK